MSLEEVESRLGSLVEADTVSQLKSTVWKERLEGSHINEPLLLLIGYAFATLIVFKFLLHFTAHVLL